MVYGSLVILSVACLPNPYLIHSAILYVSNRWDRGTTRVMKAMDVFCFFVCLWNYLYNFTLPSQLEGIHVQFFTHVVIKGKSTKKRKRKLSGNTEGEHKTTIVAVDIVSLFVFVVLRTLHC